MMKKNEKCNFKNLPFAFYLFPFAFFICGCAAFQVGGEIQAGRQALRYGDPKIALAHFQRAADMDPNYLLDFSLLDQGVWTYVGRAHYATGNLSEARKALEQARSRHDRDHVAKLYLGLVLARDGNREKGLKEIESGLRGLGNWLNYLEMNRNDGRYWDPAKNLRSAIQQDITMISGKDVNWQALIANGEWLGREFEEEIDRARRDKRRDRDDDGRDKDSGKG